MTNKLANSKVIRKPQELSFTILEVIIAVGLLTSVVMQVAGGQGSLLEITDYSKKATEATWLAKRVMSRVEYNYNQYDLKDLDTSTSASIKEAKFVDVPEDDFDYRYSIDILEWKLPLIDFLTGGGGKSADEKEKEKLNGEEKSSVAGIPGLDGIVKQIFGDHMMKVARVEVSWPDGAKRNSVGLTYLLTNQKKLDEYILTKVSVWDGIRKKMDPSAPAGGVAPPPGGTPIPGGTAVPGGTTPGTPGGPAVPGSSAGTIPPAAGGISNPALPGGISPPVQ